MTYQSIHTSRLLLMAISFVTLAVGQSGLAAKQPASDSSDYDHFRLYNDCRPMGLSVGVAYSSGPESPRGFTPMEFKLLVDRIELVAEDSLRGEHLYMGPYTGLRSDASHAFLEVSVDFMEVSAKASAVAISLRYNKVVTDPVSGWKDAAITWRSSGRGFGSGDLGGNDLEPIVDRLTDLLDGFLSEYLRVNVEACSG